jgi:hypothetical protein
MKIQVEKKIIANSVVEINFPAFYKKNAHHYIAFLSEEKMLSVFKCADLVLIDSNTTERYIRNCGAEFIKDDNIITEQQFFDFYSSVHESLSMKPQLVEK